MADSPKSFKLPEAARVVSCPGSKAKKNRSVFWIVTTHLLTTAIAMPFVAAVAATAVVSGANLQGNEAFLMTLAFQGIGYIAGTYYSLSYLRKSTSIEDPERCIRASIVTFAVLIVLGFAMNIARSEATDPLRVTSWIVFYIVIFWAFARITRQGFFAIASTSEEP